MADKVVLMNEGEIVQQGNPKILYEEPENTLAAKFIGSPPMNLINLEVEDNQYFLEINGKKVFIRNMQNKIQNKEQKRN